MVFERADQTATTAPNKVGSIENEPRLARRYAPSTTIFEKSGENLAERIAKVIVGLSRKFSHFFVQIFQRSPRPRRRFL